MYIYIYIYICTCIYIYILLPKIHKRLNNVPGLPVISNCGYYTENVSAM